MATNAIKQLLFGIALILFGLLVGLIDFPWIPIIGTLNGDLVGVISLLSGISVSLSPPEPATARRKSHDICG